MSERKTLVLDLDETLIHSDENLIDFDFQAGPFKTKKRPHLEEFLTFALETFDVGIWSSGSLEYVFLVLENLAHVIPDNSLKFVWGRERCTKVCIPDPGMYSTYLGGAYEWIKPFHKLQRAGFKKATTIAVDDTPFKWHKSYGNLVTVHEFIDDPSDTELLKLMIFLKRLDQLDDVTHFEKRRWISDVALEYLVRHPDFAPSKQDNADVMAKMKLDRETMGEGAWQGVMRQHFAEALVYDCTHPDPLD